MTFSNSDSGSLALSFSVGLASSAEEEAGASVALAEYNRRCRGILTAADEARDEDEAQYARAATRKVFIFLGGW